MYWFTADQHFGHANVIKYNNRPFKTVGDMDAELIRRFNSKVGKGDCTVHAGDFCWKKNHKEAQVYIKQLNGTHIFVKGSHDRWCNDKAPFMWRRMIDGQFIVVCHYAMRVWERSHYNSWHLYAHSHGRLPPQGKSWDVGVDNNNYYPISFEELKKIMLDRPDNFNYINRPMWLRRILGRFL